MNFQARRGYPRTNADRSFGDWLRQRRRALDLTQEELAQQVGCSAITLRKLEAESRRPSKQIAERLAEILRVAPDDRPAFLRFARGDPFAAPASATDTLAAAPQVGPSELAGLHPDEAPAAAEAPAPGESPFKGLLYFDEADAELFFGREALVERLVARLVLLSGASPIGDTRFLAVVGASGSGKSSAVRAGVVPALKRANGAGSHFEQIHVITATAHPLETLAASLTRQAESVTATATLMDDLARDARSLHLHAQRLLGPAGGDRPAGPPPRLLLVVDQFEELFTQCRSETERRAFIDTLMQAAEADGPVTVVITLRADFYAHCAPYTELRDALAQQQDYIGPMTGAELRQAIERPARLGGWVFEPGLVDLILRDAGDEPGALPLLSHALLETWRHRRGRTLLLKSYSEAGRVQGAIATTAEAVFQSMPPEEQALARSIFLRLTELGEGTQDTRRRVGLGELLPPFAQTATNTAMARVLKTLSDARLITQDDAAVEVAHEALIREWPTLRQWLSEDRDGLRLQRRLTEAAQEWDALNRETGELYRGPRLAQAADWASAHAGELNPLEQMFLAASQAYAEREAAEREAQRQRELAAAQQLAESARKLAETEKAQAESDRRTAVRLRTRNRIISAVGVLAAIIALWAAVLANRNAGLAASSAASANDAQASARIASARELSLSAISNLAVDPQLGLLLALQAVNLTYAVDHTLLPEAAGALHEAVAASHLQLSLPVLTNGEVIGVAFSPDAKRLGTLDVDGTVSLWDLSPNLPAGQSRVVFSFPGHLASRLSSGWHDITFSPDGTRLAAGGDNGFSVWEAASGQPPLDISTSFNVRTIVFSPDGRQIAASGYGADAHLYETTTGRPIARVANRGTTEDIAYSPDGQRLAISNHDQTQIWEVATDQLLLTLPPQATWANSVVFSPDGSRLATASNDGTATIWDAASGAQALLIQANLTCCLAFSPDGQQLATGGYDGVTRVWDTSTGRELFERLNLNQLVFGVAFSRGGAAGEALLATANADGTAKVWDANPDQELLTLPGADPVFSVAFSPDGARLVTGGQVRGARVWDAASGQELPGPTDRVDVIRSAVFSHDGTRIATASDYGPPKVWDAASGQLLLTLYGHNLGAWSVAFSPDDTRLATGNASAITTVWEAASGNELLTLLGAGEAGAEYLYIQSPTLGGPVDEKVAGVAFSPDGARIVTSGSSRTALVWDAGSDQKLLSLAGHTDIVEAVAYSPDGTRIATASRDGTAKVWDAATGQALFTLNGHTTSVLSVAFSPDGAWIATGSLDNTAKLWDAATGALLQNLPGHTAGVTSVAFSPDGTRLAAASLDGSTRLYQLELADLLALAKARVIRAFTTNECQQYLHGPCPTN